MFFFCQQFYELLKSDRSRIGNRIYRMPHTIDQTAFINASNKFQAGTEKLVGLFFPGVTFAAVLGQRPGVPLKPSPAVVEEILARTGTAREEVLYVGDSGVDIETAAAAGVRSAGVTWGFRDRAELIAAGARHLVDRPGELLELL